MDSSGNKYLTLDGYTDLMQKHVSDARRMADALGQIPIFSRRADRMRNCSTITRGRYCPTCHSWHTTQASLCRDRLCPNCGWALAHSRAAALMETLRPLHDVHIFAVVLTVKNCDLSQLAGSLSDMLSAFTRLTKSAAFRRAFVGYARNLEIKVNDADVHPHIHMLALSHSTHPIDKHALNDLWQRCLNVDYAPITWIKEAFGHDTADAVYECIKYTIKSSEWLHMDKSQILTFTDAIHSKKLFSSGGLLRKLCKVDIPDSVSLLCEHCGTRTVDKVLSMNEVQDAETENTGTKND